MRDLRVILSRYQSVTSSSHFFKTSCSEFITCNFSSFVKVEGDFWSKHSAGVDIASVGCNFPGTKYKSGMEEMS